MEEDTKMNVSGENLGKDRIEHGGTFRGSKRLDNWCVMLNTIVMTVFVPELSTQIFKTVRYFIKYHGINNHHGVLFTQTNTLTHPVQYSNKLC